MPLDLPDSGVRRHAVFQLWLANLGLGTLVGLNYLAHVPQSEGLKVWFFALPALVSSVLQLTVIPLLCFTVAAHFVRSTSFLGTLQAAFWTLFQILLFADTRIYNVFRYHMNGQVWNLVYTRGSEDAVHLGWQVWSTVAFGLILFVSLQTWIWRRALPRAQRALMAAPKGGLFRPAMVFGGILLPTVFLEKTIYASAHLKRDQEITRLARLFPLYTPVPMEDLASKVLGTPQPLPGPFEIAGVTLEYPRERPLIRPDGPRPNVVVLVIDCLRRDMLEPETMPRLSAWKDQGCRSFADHVSNGNSTRFGLFSLLYGLHGSYWFPFLAEQRGPVLIDELAGLGYEFGVFGSASMNYPELRATAWSAIPESVHDQFPAPEAWRRDEQAGQAMIDWLEARERSQQPFFAFLLLDSPHQTYSYPPDRTPFLPSAPDLDYMAMTRNEGPPPELLEAVRNRYKNAVHHSDDVLGRVLEVLDGSNRRADTLVVVTGDHGEEFRECGFFGHTSAFTPPQVEVPFLMRGPGIANGIETHPTSHLDFAPTVLELVGAAPESRSRWTLGGNLLLPRAGAKRVFAGWNELGLWTPDAILRVPLSLLEFDVEVFDYRWRPVPDNLDILRREHDTLEAVGEECNRFLGKS